VPQPSGEAEPVPQPLGEAEPMPQPSGEVEPIPQPSGRVESSPGGRIRPRSRPEAFGGVDVDEHYSLSSGCPSIGTRHFCGIFSGVL
jgi:hypothetical protein